MMDEETNHHIVHRCRLGKTYCVTDKALDPGPHIDVLALNFLRVLLANGVLLWGDVPLVRPPRAASGAPSHHLPVASSATATR